MVLLQGYLNYANCLGILQVLPENIKEPSLKAQVFNKSPIIFYRNGCKLASKFLGAESYLAKKFMFYLSSAGEKTHGLKVDMNTEENFFENLKLEQRSTPHKRKNNNILETFGEEDEESFDNKGLKKEFRIKKKTHHRNYKSQIEFGKMGDMNKYSERDYYEIVEKMRKMEENLHRIQELREKYQHEKKMIENDFNYIKTKSLEFYQTQNSRLSGGFNQWSSPQSSYPQSNANKFNFNTEGNYYPAQQKANNLNINPILTEANLMEFEEKNGDFEKAIVSLKYDKEKIIRESQEKDKEIQKLKDLIKKKTPPSYNNTSDDNNSYQNDSNFHIIKHIPSHPEHKKAFSQTNANQVKPSPTNDVIKRDFSAATLKFGKEIQRKEGDPKEMKRIESPPTVKNKEEALSMQFFGSTNNLQLENSNISKQKSKQGQNNPTNVTPSPLKQSNQNFGNLNTDAIHKKTAVMKTESNKSLVKLISIMEGKGSIRHITNENFRRTSIIDQISLVKTPYEVFKTLVVPKLSVVKKKMLLDNEILLFEFRTLLNDNGEQIYRIEGYNLETARAMKTAILKEETLKKVLDSIHYEDIIPLTHPLNSIFKYIDFVKHFIMPFIGVRNRINNLISH